MVRAILFLILFFAAKDRANQLFKQVHEQKSLKGRSNDAIASACLYIACRQEGVPRTFKGRSDFATECAWLKLCYKVVWNCFAGLFCCSLVIQQYQIVALTDTELCCLVFMSTWQSDESLGCDAGRPLPSLKTPCYVPTLPLPHDWI